MANLSTKDPVEAIIRAIAPVDMASPYDPAGVSGKAILITGGASGLGAAFARKWAKHGAHIFIGDIDDAAGEALVVELRRTTASPHHHFQHCDVTDWASQVRLFKAAVAASPTGGIDAVVPSAGIGCDPAPGQALFEDPKDLDAEDPPPPSTKVLDVNLTGVLYTVHLALFWLEKNPLTPPKGSDEDAQKFRAGRDRHILLIGSIGGIMPLVGAAQYTASKHALTGLFRTLRTPAFWKGVRVNMLLPSFVDTNMVSNRVMFVLAGGGGLCQLSDVVDAGTRFMADKKVTGRGVVIGPRMRVEDGEDGKTRLVEIPAPDDRGKEQAVWECYVHDYENVEAFVYRYIRLLAAFTQIRGWIGWVGDVVGLFFRREGKRS